MNKAFKTKKALGQHFLVDEHVIERIILAVQPKKDQYFIEIGPGQGALTTHLLPYVRQIDAIEYDQEVIPYLSSYCKNLGNLIIHQSDVLQFDFNTLQLPTSSRAQRGLSGFENDIVYRVVGNLPYNISTPLFFHLLKYASHIEDMCFMIQKEVADRITAIPGNKDYGRLTVMLQYYCATEFLFTVPPDAFAPPPKVNSAVIRLIPFKRPPVLANNEQLFAELVKKTFNFRRKVLRHVVKNYITTEHLEKSPIDLSLRPENLSVEDFVRLSNFIEVHKKY